MIFQEEVHNKQILYYSIKLELIYKPVVRPRLDAMHVQYICTSHVFWCNFVVTTNNIVQTARVVSNQNW